MSTALDRTLDEIISTKRKTQKKGAKKLAAKTPAKSGKGVGKVQKKQIVSFNKPAPQAPVLDLTSATKVSVQGLPRDLKQDAIKEFFQSQVGAVSQVSMNYNEKGQFRGSAVVLFKHHKSAVAAVQKYNNAPIDNGQSRLRLELLVDPTKKPLAARITANQPQPQPQQKTKQQQTKEKLQQKRKQLQQKKKAAAKPQPKKKASPKTAEQLDQEMTDYFGN